MDLFIAAAAATGVVLLAGQQINRQARRRHQQRLDTQRSDCLHIGLDLLQLLQRHRALGCRLDQPADEQRQTTALLVDECWRDWQAAGQPEPPYASWLEVRSRPRDYDAHCRLIERLIEAIRLLELDLAQRQGRPASDVAERCHALEELGRLRGLSIRAANHPSCPPEMKAELCQLCQRVNDVQLCPVVERLQEELIDSDPVTLQPTECFALLTPIIDERANLIRRSLGKGSHR